VAADTIGVFRALVLRDRYVVLIQQDQARSFACLGFGACTSFNYRLRPDFRRAAAIAWFENDHPWPARYAETLARFRVQVRVYSKDAILGNRENIAFRAENRDGAVFVDKGEH
jgi:hypothetical protein